MRTKSHLLLLSLVVSATAFADSASIQHLDDLWTRRDQPGVMKQLEADSAAAVQANPNDPEALWRACRTKQWVADGPADSNTRKNYGKESWQLCERALKVNGNLMPAHYYAALAIGNYSQAVGILAALGEGLEGKFNGHLDTAIKLDNRYEDGGGIIAKGRYYYELPWPKRNLTKSAELLQQAITMFPGNIRAYVYLAQTQLKDGKAKVAQATLEKGMALPVTYDPPEGRRAKDLGRVVQAEIAKELK